MPAGRGPCSRSSSGLSRSRAARSEPRVKLNRRARGQPAQRACGRCATASWSTPSTRRAARSGAVTPGIRNAFRMMVPLAANSAVVARPSAPPTSRGSSRSRPPDKWPAREPFRRCGVNYRTNPSISSLNAPEVAERVAEFPFIVSFSLHPRRDELDGRLPPAGGDGPREPPAHPHRVDPSSSSSSGTSRAGRCASRSSTRWWTPGT